MTDELTDWKENPESKISIIDDNSSLPEGIKKLEEQENPPSPQILEHRRKVAEKASQILEENDLPDHGESRVWANPTLDDPEVTDPENPDFKMVSWNIQKGYKLEEQIKYLKETSPDVVLLQEVDWDCERSGNKNIALELAAGAGYKYAAFTTMVVEVGGEEFPDSKRGNKLFNLVGKVGEGGGLHGVAILSKHPISEVSAIKLSHKTNRKERMERWIPKQGGRVAQKSKIRIGNREVSIYNTHLSPADITTTERLQQWDKIADDAENDPNPTVIGGDLNTMNSGLAGLLSKAANRGKIDPLGKSRRPFQSDAKFWQETEFADSKKREQLEDGVTNPRTKRFEDPNPKSSHGLGGKLDHTLFEQGEFENLKSSLGPKGPSDHRPIIVEAKFS